MRDDITHLDREAVKQGIADGTLLVVDVREPHEFAAGRIPGSVSMPLSGFDPGDLPWAADRRVVFSCAAGVRSVRAIDLARAEGHAAGEHYLGGFKDWAASGEPVEL